MGRTEVHKFGGTSVGDARRIAGCADILAEAAKGTRIVAVSSAMGGVTDRLVAASDAAARGASGEALAIVEQIAALHEVALDGLDGPGRDEARAECRRICEGIRERIRAVAVLGHATPRARDQVLAAGEKLAIRLLALALAQRGASAVALDADTFLETDDRFGEASALPGVAERTIRGAILPLLDRGVIPVVTGFTGKAPDGATTTLGRGGSDLTATLIAAALRADEVTIWTDVEGVFSADPRAVPEARVIRQLNFREAAEMSYYGAKVLHPRTMIPVATLRIPVRTRSSFEPRLEGTLVDGGFTPGSHPVKAVTAVRRHALVSVEGKGMSGVPGVAARVFRALADRKLSVTMISQSSSESSICLALPADEAFAAESALKQEFRADLSRGDVDEVAVKRHVGLVAVVGLGMAHTPGVAARVFDALGSRGVNVLAIAQGSSELNISLAVDEAQTDDAVRALHAAFRLDRRDTGEETGKRLDLLLVGSGKIGRALVSLLRGRGAHSFERFNLAPRVVALADRSGYLFRPNGIVPEDLDRHLAGKAAGRSIATIEGARPGKTAADMVREAMEYRLARPILVDVSDADDSQEAFFEAFRLGCDVVTANKKPMAGPLESYKALWDKATTNGRRLKAEATVGAGLPVIDTLEMLLSTGDKLVRAEGCLSGTLGYLMTKLEEGVPFSKAVAEAVERGYTEPNPVVDLSGMDVARKATILGRLSGLTESDEPPAAESLVDPELATRPVAEVLERIKIYDETFARRVESAHKRGAALRYVARVEAGHIEVGPVDVPLDSPAGRLRGTDNLIVFTSERYDTRPLVVMGPGAGVEVTAMAVLGDILRIAAERSRA